MWYPQTFCTCVNGVTGFPVFPPPPTVYTEGGKNEKCALALLKLTKTDSRITFLIMSALLRKTLSGCLPKILITQIGHKIDFLQILYVNCTLSGYFEKHFWALNAFFDSVQGGSPGGQKWTF